MASLDIKKVNNEVKLLTTSSKKNEYMLISNKFIMRIDSKLLLCKPSNFMFCTIYGAGLPSYHFDDFRCHPDDKRIYRKILSYFFEKEKYDTLSTLYKSEKVIYSFCYSNYVHKVHDIKNKNDNACNDACNDFVNYILTYKNDIKKNTNYVITTNKNENLDIKFDFTGTITNTVYITNKLNIIICILVPLITTLYNTDDNIASFSLPDIYAFKHFKIESDTSYDNLEDIPKDIINKINSFIPMY
jgi:hypothetical protein